MRVYLHYDPVEQERVEIKPVTIKVKLPKSWKSGPAHNLKDTLVTNVNKKLEAAGAPSIDGNEFHLALKDGTAILADEVVSDRIPDRADLYLVSGPSETVAEVKQREDAEKAAREAKEAADPMLTCKNFGCNKKYRESENCDGCCVCHSKPPIFHETKKMWSCCNASAYDWESFMALKGCTRRKHSTEPPAQLFLGGTDVRNQYEPKRIDEDAATDTQPPSAPSAPASTGQIVTPLTKLQNLRKSLVSVGVTGATFDLARDAVKARHEDTEDPEKVWLATMEDIATKISETLETMYE